LTRTLFLRHGESVSNAHPTAASLPAEQGDRLTERGREQARAAAEALAPLRPTRILTSTMGRARETTELVNERLRLPVTELDYIHELRESDDYATLAPEEQKLRRWSERMREAAEDPDSAPRGAESWNAVLGRVRRLKRELEQRPVEELPLVVTHGLFLRFYLFDSLLGDRIGPADAPLLWRARSLNCGLSIFVRGERWHPADPEIPGWSCLTWMARTWEPPELPREPAPGNL
jgi:probable phosphoglycerate mutase